MHPDDLEFGIATEADVAELIAVRNAAATDLTARHGHGHWSRAATERGQLRELRTSRILVVRRGPDSRDRRPLVGMLRLATKKPWAIDVSYFSPVPRALYLQDMVVDPRYQRRGIGRRLLDTARDITIAWPARSIRLDAYDSPAGAADFYAKSGFREVGRVVYRGVGLVYFEWVAD